MTMTVLVPSLMDIEEGSMAKFMFVFRGGAYVRPDLSPDEAQAHFQKWMDWVKAMTEAESFVGGDPLSTEGQVIRGNGKAVSDGPYAEAKDLVTGYIMVETSDLAAASEIARDCPIYELDGSVEVRPVATDISGS